MKPLFHSVVLFVKDLEKSKKFYTEVLGQEVEYDFGNNIGLKGGISLWKIMADHVISRSGKHSRIKATKAFEIYFETDDLNTFQEIIVKQKLNILHDLMEEPWGQRTIRFYDPDNNLIEVGETLATFVTRMAISGMNPVEISAKTTIPVEIVRALLK
jgi:catechol 2,3-dioxygenase-like lactoylglutathione lyase family enzyme